MRIRVAPRAAWLAACVLTAGTIACAHPGQINPQVQGASPASPPIPAPRAVASQRVDFAAQVRPILEARCQPCHFEGGKMYARLPFDRAATVLELREKLFTRIKDEGEQRTIREFLSAHPAGGSRPTGPLTGLAVSTEASPREPEAPLKPNGRLGTWPAAGRIALLPAAFQLQE